MVALAGILGRASLSADKEALDGYTRRDSSANRRAIVKLGRFYRAILFMIMSIITDNTRG